MTDKRFAGVVQHPEHPAPGREVAGASPAPRSTIAPDDQRRGFIKVLVEIHVALLADKANGQLSKAAAQRAREMVLAEIAQLKGAGT